MKRNSTEEIAMTDSSATGPILVLGGTGKTGARVAERLSAGGVDVRVGSRSSGPPFDWEDRGTWPAALAGASAAYISYYPDLAVPGAPEAVGAFTERALAGGTRRLVLLSGRGEEEAQRAEEVLAQFISALAEQDLPADVVGLVSYLFTEVLDGRNAEPQDGVRRALGRAPRDFGEYARRTAATGVWA
jgi:hypothetical protein